MDDRVTFTFHDCGAVQSAEEFLQSVFQLRKETDYPKIIYRGHGSIDYRLIPSIGRPHKYAGRTKTFLDVDERDLLHRFRRRAYPHFGRSLSAGEALFIGRHYGLPSRILDWTANALYGLYFACISREEEPGVVWGMRQLPTALNPYDIAGLQSEEDLLDKYSGDERNTPIGTRTED